MYSLAAAMVLQTLIFSKSKFKTSEEAKKWASSHKFKSNTVRETGDSWRLRQRPPTDFDQKSFRTVSMTDGVTAVMGKLKSAKADVSDDEIILMYTEGIIRKEGDKWVIYTHDGSKKLGTFTSKKAAVKRLREIEYFKHQGKGFKQSLADAFGDSV